MDADEPTIVILTPFEESWEFCGNPTIVTGIVFLSLTSSIMLAVPGDSPSQNAVTSSGCPSSSIRRLRIDPAARP